MCVRENKVEEDKSWSLFKETLLDLFLPSLADTGQWLQKLSQKKGANVQLPVLVLS